MTDPTSDPHSPVELVRARRFELVDEVGRVRAVLGDLSHDADEPGLVLRARDGSERVALFLADVGPKLALAMDGNQALELGVDDVGTEALEPGPYVKLKRPGFCKGSVG